MEVPSLACQQSSSQHLLQQYLGFRVPHQGCSYLLSILCLTQWVLGECCIANLLAALPFRSLIENLVMFCNNLSQSMFLAVGLVIFAYGSHSNLKSSKLCILSNSPYSNL